TLIFSSVLFFFFLLLLSLTSTLFHYTTLFRSRNIGATSVRAMSGICPRRVRLLSARCPCPQALSANTLARSVRVLSGQCPAFVRDRKSTRLNSSHVKISYAVFCLKKKKTNYQL